MAGGLSTVFLLVVVSSLWILHHFIVPKKQPKEPPWIPSLLPIIGHALGLFWHKNRYYTRLCKQYGHRIYSLAMANGRVYVISSPEIVAAIQRLPKKVSFWFIEAEFTARIGGMSNASKAKLLKDEQALLVDGLKATHAAMAPQKLAPMIARSAQCFEDSFDALGQEGSPDRRIDLWDWIQHAVTVATTEAVYGSSNPYRSPGVEKAFWDFVDDTIPLMTGLWPRIFARRGFLGRERVVAEFQKYLAANDASAGSALLRARMQVLSPAFENVEELARFETVNGIAILANTVPTAFWAVFHMFANRDLLQQVRAEVQKALRVEKNTRVVDLKRLLEVPLFDSIVKETLRHRTSGSGPRMVTEDVLLDERYLLKKDSMVIIPNHVMHFDEQIWGGSVGRFDCSRFSAASSTSKSEKIHPVAFRGFGGGANLCPGKTFATAEVTALLALMAGRYEVLPAEGSWEDPGQDTSNMSLAIAPPKKAVVVKMVPRNVREEEKWVLQL